MRIEKNVFQVCLVVWFYCLAMALPPLFGWSAYVPEGYLTSCSWDYLTRTPTNRAYYIYLLTLGFLIPVSVITYCYVFILAAIFAHSREMKSVKSTGSNFYSAHAHPNQLPFLGGSMYGSLSGSLSRGVAYCMNPSNPTRATMVSWASSTIRTAEIILMLILLFLVAWVPYAVVTLVGQFGDVELITPWVSALPGIFAKVGEFFYFIFFFKIWCPKFLSDFFLSFFENDPAFFSSYQIFVKITIFEVYILIF